MFVNVSYQYIDGRKDVFFDGNTFGSTSVLLGSYQLVNTLVKYEVLKNRFSVFATVTNLLNEDFVENIGYATRGRNFRLGLNFNL